MAGENGFHTGIHPFLPQNVIVNVHKRPNLPIDGFGHFCYSIGKPNPSIPQSEKEVSQ
jgi:hypothetical protein